MRLAARRPPPPPLLLLLLLLLLLAAAAKLLRVLLPTSSHYDRLESCAHPTLLIITPSLPAARTAISADRKKERGDELTFL